MSFEVFDFNDLPQAKGVKNQFILVGTVHSMEEVDTPFGKRKLEVVLKVVAPKADNPQYQKKDSFFQVSFFSRLAEEAMQQLEGGTPVRIKGELAGTFNEHGDKVYYNIFLNGRSLDLV